MPERQGANGPDLAGLRAVRPMVTGPTTFLFAMANKESSFTAMPDLLRRT
ncbi:hypothetical protein LFML04_0519 [Leptospirillum ferriphilum ML-04]|uniref:Uncharacterized protein n=1 Tax=Leptospirillum ferriphilum (strain ML-04) TaxID=1048260 RepID=J9Z9D3_LEPFM|nr:hypothetical protein LFML04_0519 [Leptospirillum ferriphilum ML-04]